ncbi:hypothetical protein [Xanthomonas sp. SI]|uniref:hypothetical protein n=1 Tax=Xanthomonas sp. SI TaxID=2724123 RepID=UPI00163A359D|nr:hypothetical protein [Xanthomonas sp. SI]
MPPFSAEKHASPAHFSAAHTCFDDADETLSMHFFPGSKMRCNVKVSTRGFINDCGHVIVWTSFVTLPKQVLDDRMALPPASPLHTRMRRAFAGESSPHLRAAAVAVQMR